jgi:hypothetical protein
MPDEVERIHKLTEEIETKEKDRANYVTTKDKNERRRQLSLEKRWAQIINAVGSELLCPICNRKVEQSNAWTLTTDPIQCRSCAQKDTRQHRTTGTILDHASIDCPYILNMKNLLCQVMIKGLRTKANISIAALSEAAGIPRSIITVAENDGYINLEDAAALLKALGLPLNHLTITLR